MGSEKEDTLRDFKLCHATGRQLPVYRKTKYVEILENYPPYQFFIRPRRFGKSLFLSMLAYYYDRQKKEHFDNLFGDLYIGKNPTANRNKYLVLNLSFAGIVTSEGKDRLISLLYYLGMLTIKGVERKCHI